MKKALVLLLALAMVLSLAACGSAPASTPAEEPAAAPAAAEGEVYTVGICQLVQHVALDAATQGFKDALTEALGDKVQFVEQNAANDIPTCATIVNGFVSDGVDLILANATPALQAAVAATDSIPILGTAVTEYGVALDIKDFNGTVGGNVSGTSDLAPLDQQAAMILELFPDAKKVGILYCSAEPNSVYHDVAAVTATACDENDVLYIPTDNTAASCTEAINNVAEPAGVPIIAGEEGICAGCGVATLSINYYDLGVTTGKMAAKILTGEANISEMPIEYFPDPVKKYNPAICEALGITVPEDYVAIG